MNMYTDPDYRRRGIAFKTLNYLVEDAVRNVIAYDNEMHFYTDCGFEEAKDASPMFIT